MSKLSDPKQLEINLEIGKRLRLVRIAKGWTQQMCGAELQIGRDNYAGIEIGMRAIRACEVVVLANAWSISPIEFMP